MATSSGDYYVPTNRSRHSTHIVGDYLYMWGGDIHGLPKLHDNEVKRRMTSVIEIFHLLSGRWEQRPTIGKPPLGVKGYGSTVIGNKIYYFGGSCNHSGCCHNSINSLSTDSLTWNKLFPTNNLSDECPKMKADCGMISFTFNKEDYLLVMGGYYTHPCPEQPPHGCIIVCDAYVYTNEIHFYQLTSGRWVAPNVIGHHPYFCRSCIPLPNNRALVIGGLLMFTVYLAQCTETEVYWQEIKKPKPKFFSFKSVIWPNYRHCHANVAISQLHVMMVGGSTYPLGWGPPYQTIDESWLFNTNTNTWTKLTLPTSVTKRTDHSLSVWSVSPTTVWAVQFGGKSDYGSSGTNDTIVIELIRDEVNDQWSVGDVITNLKSTKEYQLKLPQERQETSVQPSWKHGQPQLTVQPSTHFQPPSSSRQESKEKDNENRHLTQQLETSNIDRQDTKQQQMDLIDMTRAFQENFQTIERQLQQLQLRNQELEEKQQLLKETQQKLQDQQEKERQKLQNSEERERDFHQKLQKMQQVNTTLQQQIQLLQEQSEKHFSHES